MNTPTLARPAGQLHPAHPSLRDITQDDLLLASASAVWPASVKEKSIEYPE